MFYDMKAGEYCMAWFLYCTICILYTISKIINKIRSKAYL